MLSMLLIGVWQVTYGRRPPRTTHHATLFEGVIYERRILSEPRPVILHIVMIDLTVEGIDFAITPPDLPNETLYMQARTTSDFVAESGVQLAINGSFFYPFHSEMPWDYFPHEGDTVRPLGETIVDQQVLSPTEEHYQPVCFLEDRVEIVEGACSAETQHALSGNAIFLQSAEPIHFTDPYNATPYSRVALATNQQGNIVWLIIVDGKQKFYSEGLSLNELGSIVQALGAYNAINLDGGGSTTLAIASDDGATLLNAPFHTRLPMRERPVANHLGIIATGSNHE